MEELQAAVQYAEGELNQLKNDAATLPNNDENANGCCYAAQRATELYEGLITSVRTYVNNTVINHVQPHVLQLPPGPPAAAAAAAAAGGKRRNRKTRRNRSRK